MAPIFKKIKNNFELVAAVKVVVEIWSKLNGKMPFSFLLFELDLRAVNANAINPAPNNK